MNIIESSLPTPRPAKTRTNQASAIQGSSLLSTQDDLRSLLTCGHKILINDVPYTTHLTKSSGLWPVNCVELSQDYFGETDLQAILQFEFVPKVKSKRTTDNTEKKPSSSKLRPNKISNIKVMESNQQTHEDSISDDSMNDSNKKKRQNQPPPLRQRQPSAPKDSKLMENIQGRLSARKFVSLKENQKVNSEKTPQFEENSDETIPAPTSTLQTPNERNNTKITDARRLARERVLLKIQKDKERAEFSIQEKEEKLLQRLEESEIKARELQNKTKDRVSRYKEELEEKERLEKERIVREEQKRLEDNRIVSSEDYQAKMKRLQRQAAKRRKEFQSRDEERRTREEEEQRRRLAENRRRVDISTTFAAPVPVSSNKRGSMFTQEEEGEEDREYYDDDEEGITFNGNHLSYQLQDHLQQRHNKSHSTNNYGNDNNQNSNMSVANNKPTQLYSHQNPHSPGKKRFASSAENPDELFGMNEETGAGFTALEVTQSNNSRNEKRNELKKKRTNNKSVPHNNSSDSEEEDDNDSEKNQEDRNQGRLLFPSSSPKKAFEPFSSEMNNNMNNGRQLQSHHYHQNPSNNSSNKYNNKTAAPLVQKAGPRSVRDNENYQDEREMDERSVSEKNEDDDLSFWEQPPRKPPTFDSKDDNHKDNNNNKKTKSNHSHKDNPHDKNKTIPPTKKPQQQQQQLNQGTMDDQDDSDFSDLTDLDCNPHSNHPNNRNSDSRTHSALPSLPCTQIRSSSGNRQLRELQPQSQQQPQPQRSTNNKIVKTETGKVPLPPPSILKNNRNNPIPPVDNQHNDTSVRRGRITEQDKNPQKKNNHFIDNNYNDNNHDDHPVLRRLQAADQKKNLAINSGSQSAPSPVDSLLSPQQRNIKKKKSHFKKLAPLPIPPFQSVPSSH
jgi:hypothetical protein